MKTSALTGLVLCSVVAAACRANGEDSPVASSGDDLTADQMVAPLKDESGSVQTTTPSGAIDTTNPFFQSLGTNGRFCGSCHVAENGWTITPAGVQARFDATNGTDPIFNPLDGSDSPVAPYGTADERRAAASNLLARGTIRVGLPRVKPLANWDIDVEIVADPKNSNALTAKNGQISFFRRPLPTTNLRMIATINWDGRNTVNLTDMRPGLLKQANGATLVHAQGSPLTADQQAAIVDFETSLVTAQVKSDAAGRLDADGATGGPFPLLTQAFSIGMNPPKAFDVFDAWNDLPRTGINAARADVAAGQRLFNERRFGPNGDRTCATCHNAPNVGGSTTFAFFDDGISDAANWNHDVPLYRVTQKSNTANSVLTTDPGRAMVTGQWADMNKFKVPGLRGLAARAPYFHDGSVPTLAGVVDHYNTRNSIGLTDDEKRQLTLFLESL